MLDGTLTIAVKQAVDIVGPQTDFLCYNTYNVRRFRTPNKDTIRVYTPDPASNAVQLNRPTMSLPLGPGDDLLRDSVSATGKFSEYELSKTLLRPRGPGLMYETVLHLAYHLGSTRIVTIGWDIATPEGTNAHFADQGASANFYSQLSGAASRPAPRRNLGPFEKPARVARTWMRHVGGETYNRARMQPREAELTAHGSALAAQWLASAGVELRVVSDRSLVAGDIGRWTLDDLERALRDNRSSGESSGKS